MPRNMDNFVISTYPNVVIPGFPPNSRNSCREKPDTEKTDLSPLADLFPQDMVSAVMTLSGCSACGVSKTKVNTSVPSGTWLSHNLHIWEVWSDQT